VTLSTTGACRPLGVAVDQAAYRILQEALTNASRHGAGTADIELAFGDASVQLTVVNHTLPDGARGPTGGHGLIGMGERATLVGGSLEKEHADGTFRIRALLPYRGHQP